jgi:AraC family transcriptional regulator
MAASQAGDASPRSHYEGDFVAWNGGCMFIGAGGATVAPHAHYAIQLVVGAPAGLQVQFGRRGCWEPVAAALVPSRCVHAIDVSRCAWSAVVFVEPETVEGRGIATLLGGKPLALASDALPVPLQRLEQAWRIQQSADAVRSVAMGLIEGLSRTARQQTSDPRVLQAIEYLRLHCDDSVSLEEVAAAVKLSPSRFRHLFVDETGMPLRTYVLWRRLLQVWELLMQGENLSRAAHAAGFADSAHLSRTARTMFGLAPSAMKMTGPLSAIGSRSTTAVESRAP